MSSSYDLCVIGGGINGAGIARDAAGRGLKVLLLEKSDLAAGTSSASTKLIHGGLRYLEYCEFGLVRHSLEEREILLAIAPHAVWPMKFILPHEKGMRPRWMIGAGLSLYDHLARRRVLRASGRIVFKAGSSPLEEKFRKGFHYADCATDDSRLVVLNALDAAEKGAEIKRRAECVKLEAREGRWIITIKENGQTSVTEARIVVNAAGPWARTALESWGVDVSAVPAMRLVKGSHIIVKCAFEGTDAYILQQPDHRIVFAIPYESEFTLIGTTEESFDGDPADPRISDAETEYLLAAFNRSFRKKIFKEDIVWTYSGVRPLLDDGKAEARAVTRDYKLFEHEGAGAPLISVLGGKLTTYRVLSEHTVDMVLKNLGKEFAPWTFATPLPGGDIPHGDFSLFVTKQASRYGWLPAPLIFHCARRYGTRMDRFLEGAKSMADLGQHFGDELYEAEVVYLIRNEWARTSEDILWRRTKHGLRVSEETVRNLERFLGKAIQ